MRTLLVLLLLASGKSVKEMGAELSLSVKTISTYRTRVFEKLRFKSNADAVRYVAAERLLD
jgi:two-component system invasion response regulator UvrY